MLNLVANGPSGYNLTNSVRLRSSASAYLSRTPASAGNQQTWTWSGWFKRGTLGVAQSLFSAGNAGTDAGALEVTFNSSDQIVIQTWTTTYRLSTQVFRDPSAWYHIVVVSDTTNATAQNRLRIYINGTEITTWTTNTAVTLNRTWGYNGAFASRIGVEFNPTNSANQLPFDGYLAEVNFIDGQALTPSSFGSTNSTTGVWQPAKYTGTYGTNGFYLPFTNTNNSTYAAAFNGSTQYLTVADNAALELGSSNFCIEAWVNYNSLTGSNYLLSKVADATSATAAWLIYKNNNTGVIGFYASSNGSSYDMFSAATIGTLTAGTWNHIAVYRSGNTFYGALNGKVVTLGTSSSSIFNNTSAVGINAAADGGGKLASSISNFRIVTGSAVYGTSNFTPPSSALTAITGTQLLTLQNATIIDNSTNAFTITNNGTTTTSVSYPFSANISNDYSGNGNNWIPNNIQVITPSATTYDAMTDVPTLTSATVANYCTLNPLSFVNSPTFSNGNLTQSATLDCLVKGTIGVTSGKWYWECVQTAGTNPMYGLAVVDSTNSFCGGGTTSWGYYANTGLKYYNNVGTAYGSSYTINDIIGVAFDADAGTLTFYKNNVSQGVAFTGLTGNIYVPAGGNGSNTNSYNFGQRPFTYTPPTGFKALNTYNLPDSTIVQGNKYMDATLWTGNGTTQTITGLNFKPDFVWIKRRNIAADHVLYDSVRTLGVCLSSNLTSAEPSQTNGMLTSFNSNGYGVAVVSGNNSTNGSTQTYVGWSWQAGQGTTSTNTSGSITSTVSVNASAGFSIVTYTGNGTGGATVGHGLGVSPAMVIVKCRSSAYIWPVYHKSLAASNNVFLEQTTASTNITTGLNSGGIGGVSSTTFTCTSGTTNPNNTNQSTQTYVAYCWAAISGFSAFGSYTGNGSADGPFVYLGFRPKFILFKVSSVLGYDWNIYDTARNTYNAVNLSLFANLSNAEATTDPSGCDILSNGFKIRGTSNFYNNSGGTIIYAAFAENPFKNALAK